MDFAVLKVLCVALLVGSCFAYTVRYDGCQVIRVVPQTQDQFQKLDQFQDLLSQRRITQIWLSTGGPGQPMDILVTPQNKKYIMSYLQPIKAPITTMIEDLQAAIDRESKNDIAPNSTLADFDYGKYHTYGQIMTWIDDITTAYRKVVEKFRLTVSFEGREINAFYISSNRSSTPTKRAMYLQGGMHAREWISTATVIYIAGQLIMGYGKNANITRMVNEFDWYIVPVVNVDGYEYSHTGDRFWRKTRAKRQGKACRGVDPNANFDIRWCRNRNFDACSDKYCGPEPFSEPCTKAVSLFLNNRQNEIKAFLDFHSYDQLWFQPWGYTTDVTADAAKQNASSIVAIDALQVLFGTQFKAGPMAQLGHMKYGSSIDWTYGTTGIVYSAEVQLRDKGLTGFLLPSDQIIPSGEETLQAVMALADFIIKNPS